MSTCKINETILGIDCGLEALEDDPRGYCILHSHKKDKDIDRFNEALKDKLTVWDYNFSFIFFPGPVSFQGKRFTNFVTFTNANFNDSADFMGVIFDDGCSFSWTTFAGEVIFSFARILNGKVIFDSINRNGKPTSWKVVFSELWIEKEKSLIFRNLSLDRAVFSGTDLRRVEFHNIEWQRYWGRNAVYDEVLLFDQKIARISYIMQEGLCAEIFPFEKLNDRPDHPSYGQYLEVEKLYRYLKINYEEERDFKNVGNFYYGEMEMHRRANPW